MDKYKSKIDNNKNLSEVILSLQEFLELTKIPKEKFQNINNNDKYNELMKEIDNKNSIINKLKIKINILTQNIELLNSSINNILIE